MKAIEKEGTTPGLLFCLVFSKRCGEEYLNLGAKT
jgi:hypothetical protein